MAAVPRGDQAMIAETTWRVHPLRSRVDHAVAGLLAASMCRLFADGAGFEQADHLRLAHFVAIRPLPVGVSNPRLVDNLRPGGAERSQGIQ